MKTLNRQTASFTPTRNEVEALSRAARTLWSATTVGGSRRRQSLLEQLMCLESDIERLLIRSTIGELRSEDVGELDSCTERLAQLERRWRTDSAPVIGSSEGET